MSRPEARGPRPFIAAASISSTVAALFQEPRRGTVLATFVRSCYLDLEGNIVAVVAEELLNGPLNIVMGAGPAVRFEHVRGGGTVAATAEEIHIDGFASISLRDALLWNPALIPWSPEDIPRITTHLGLLPGRVIADAPADSFMRASRIQSALSALSSALRSGSPEAVASAAEALAGLGIGLTPSGDDVLVGSLVAISAMAGPDAVRIRGAIVQAAAGRTTRISAAYLQAAARGEAGEAWHRLLAALAGKSTEEVIAAARGVMAFGETSGADMLTGFLLATDALLEEGPHVD